MYCDKHCCWYYSAKCPKCITGEPPHLRNRSDVADPNEWKRYLRMGWVK